MSTFLSYFLPCFCSFAACIGFCILFNIHGVGIFICAFGGTVGWFVYLLAAPLAHNDIIQAFLASLAVAAYAELMARIRKCPATVYALIASLPLVPGAGIYYTMEYAISGEAALFLETGMHTLGLAGALALGLLLVASLVRILNTFHRRRLAGRP